MLFLDLEDFGKHRILGRDINSTDIEINFDLWKPCLEEIMIQYLNIANPLDEALLFNLVKANRNTLKSFHILTNKRSLETYF